jgi:VWFA-related protein
MAEGDVAAVVFTGGGTGAAQTFTGDKRLLQEAVGRFMGRKLPSATLERLRAIEFQRNLLANEPRPEGAPPPPENRLAPRPGLERDPHDAARTNAARASMETLESVARGFAGVQGRRKAILFFSEGIDYDTLDVMGAVQRSASVVRSSMRETIATAARSSVAVYSIDPRGPVGPIGSEVLPMTTPAEAAAFGIDSRSLGQELRQSRDSLRRLAEETGGIAVVDTNDYATAYERIVRASSQYYLLGFYPLESKRDGAFRRIAVRVERAGLTVLAREGLRPTARAARREGDTRLGRGRGDVARAAGAARQPLAAARARARRDRGGVQGQRPRRHRCSDHPAVWAGRALRAAAGSPGGRDRAVARRDRPTGQGAGRRAPARPAQRRIARARRARGLALRAEPAAAARAIPAPRRRP